MSPVVLEPPPLNIHMARMQQFNPNITSEHALNPNGELRTNDADELNFSSGVLSPNHPRCSNCGVTDSPLWRRDPEGNTVCNACGGGCTSCYFSGFLALQRPKVACPSPGLFLIWFNFCFQGGTCVAPGRSLPAGQ